MSCESAAGNVCIDPCSTFERKEDPRSDVRVPHPCYIYILTILCHWRFKLIHRNRFIAIHYRFISHMNCIRTIRTEFKMYLLISTSTTHACIYILAGVPGVARETPISRHPSRHPSPSPVTVTRHSSRHRHPSPSPVTVTRHRPVTRPVTLRVNPLYAVIFSR